MKENISTDWFTVWRFKISRSSQPLRYQDSQSSHISSSSQISRSSETSWSCQIHHQHCDVLWSSVARQLLLSSSNAEENILYGCCKVWTQAWQKQETNISRKNIMKLRKLSIQHRQKFQAPIRRHRLIVWWLRSQEPLN